MPSLLKQATIKLQELAVQGENRVKENKYVLSLQKVIKKPLNSFTGKLKNREQENQPPQKPPKKDYDSLSFQIAIAKLKQRLVEEEKKNFETNAIDSPQVILGSISDFCLNRNSGLERFSKIKSQILKDILQFGNVIKERNYSIPPKSSPVRCRRERNPNFFVEVMKESATMRDKINQFKNDLKTLEMIAEQERHKKRSKLSSEELENLFRIVDAIRREVNHCQKCFDECYTGKACIEDTIRKQRKRDFNLKIKAEQEWKKANGLFKSRTSANKNNTELTTPSLSLTRAYNPKEILYEEEIQIFEEEHITDAQRARIHKLIEKDEVTDKKLDQCKDIVNDLEMIARNQNFALRTQKHRIELAEKKMEIVKPKMKYVLDKTATITKLVNRYV